MVEPGSGFGFGVRGPGSGFGIAKFGIAKWTCRTWELAKNHPPTPVGFCDVLFSLFPFFEKIQNPM